MSGALSGVLVLNLVSGAVFWCGVLYLVCYICRETDASYSSIQPPETDNTETLNGSTRLLGKQDNRWDDGAVATISATKDQDAERIYMHSPGSPSQENQVVQIRFRRATQIWSESESTWK